ncbi:MAG: hypothetical protein SGCHY_004624, partial [Lobulomycetales sp.]
NKPAVSPQNAAKSSSGNTGGTDDPGNSGGTDDPGNPGGTDDPGNTGGTETQEDDPGNPGERRKEDDVGRGSGEEHQRWTWQEKGKGKAKDYSTGEEDEKRNSLRMGRNETYETEHSPKSAAYTKGSGVASVSAEISWAGLRPGHLWRR